MPIISGGGSGGGAWTLIAKTVLGASAPSFDFQNISGNFNHLRLIAQLRDDSAGTSLGTSLIRLNNDSGTNYNTQVLSGNNVSTTASPLAATTSGTGPLQVNGGANANYFGFGQILIPFYGTGATAFRQILIESGSVDSVAANDFCRMGATVWKSTSAVTRVTVLTGAGSNFVAGSAGILYGIT